MTSNFRCQTVEDAQSFNSIVVLGKKLKSVQSTHTLREEKVIARHEQETFSQLDSLHQTASG